uniref:Calcineurin-like phosphoesterase domain-containing protein n=1 Tax=Odontella aurita TaxID=265563 RepID=A0A7S4MI19_9STRA
MPSAVDDSDDDDDDPDSEDPDSEDSTHKSSRARLTVVQITDVYTLDNFPSLRTMLADMRSRSPPGSELISILTGDFLAPYLLSSVDKGEGMMNALAETPVDYLTWGNHEADVDHRTVCRHVRNFPGVWLNSNMRDHETMEYQKDYDVVEVKSEDGTNVRRIGLTAVLSDDPALYSHFKPPGAFGGAHISDPWETLREYKTKLEDPDVDSGGENCDVVLPLQHTYVPDDHRTCREFDFPVLLSGHDHHRVDEVVDGTRLLKPGLDGIYATVLDLTWDDARSSSRPTVRAKFVRCDGWSPDPKLERECERAYDALAPLRNTELARVPPPFEPLSSVNSRGVVCSMGRFVCSLLRSSLNTSRRQRAHAVDAVLLMGGNVRGGTDYPEGSFFSLEALEAEIKPDEVMGVVPMPGWLLAEGVEATHSGDPIPGWMQYDDGVREEWTPGEDGEGSRPRVTHVRGEKIDPDRVYRVATKVGDLTNGQSPPWTRYFSDHPEVLPPKGAYVNIHAELMSFFARNVWRKIWEAVSPERRLLEECGEDPDEECGIDADPGTCDPRGRFEALAVAKGGGKRGVGVGGGAGGGGNGGHGKNPIPPGSSSDDDDDDDDNVLTVDDIHMALSDVLGLSVDDTERSLAKFVHNFADTTGDGRVTLADFEQFCEEMPGVYEQNKWRLAYPRTKKSSSPSSSAS